jgi:hypothetical protein
MVPGRVTGYVEVSAVQTTSWMGVNLPWPLTQKQNQCHLSQLNSSLLHLPMGTRECMTALLYSTNPVSAHLKMMLFLETYTSTKLVTELCEMTTSILVNLSYG